MVILPAHTVPGKRVEIKESTSVHKGGAGLEKLRSLTVVVLVRCKAVGTGRGSTSKTLAVAVGERSTTGVSLSGRLRGMVLSLETGKGLVQDGKVHDAVRISEAQFLRNCPLKQRDSQSRRGLDRSRICGSEDRERQSGRGGE